MELFAAVIPLVVLEPYHARQTELKVSLQAEPEVDVEVKLRVDLIYAIRNLFAPKEEQLDQQ